VPANFRDVKVVLRSANGNQRAWMVEVDEKSSVDDLLPDLVQALQIGEPDDYDLRWEGSIGDPVLVLSKKTRSRARNPRGISAENE
jgi:hypothetical protein